MSKRFSRFAGWVSNASGHWLAFSIALFLVVAWLVGGVFVGFNDPVYQLYVNTGTTIVTFLMVFLIQSTQNRDNLAVNVKLDGIVEALDGVSNALIDIEDADPERLRQADEARKGTT